MRGSSSSRLSRIVLMACMGVAIAAFDACADEKADSVMRGFFDLAKEDNSSATATMVLISANGSRKTRTIRKFSRETERGTDTFIEFLEPADVRGTRFLTLSNRDGDDDQRLYMPALKKVRRISASGKSGKFMGSDIYFYDMEDRDFDDSKYSFLGEEMYGGRDSWVIEGVPLDENAPYSKVHLWVSKEDNFIYKQECYDGGGKLFKTIVMVEVKRIDGILITTKMVVDNHRDDHKTLLALEDVRINSGVDTSVFSVQNLER